VQRASKIDIWNLLAGVEGHIFYDGVEFKTEAEFRNGTEVFKCMEQCSKTIVCVGRGDFREFGSPHGHRVVSNYYYLHYYRWF
jgi:hypothetical protein